MVRVHTLPTSFHEAACEHEVFYDVLFDTKDFFFLREGRRLWRRAGSWLLRSPCSNVEMFARSDAVVRYELLEGKPALEQVTAMSTDRLLPIVTIRTCRVRSSDTEWTDYASWDRGRTGYYAVNTRVFHSAEEACTQLQQSNATVMPSKALACLSDIMPILYPRDKELFVVSTMAPTVIRRTPECSLEDSSGDDESEHDMEE